MKDHPTTYFPMEDNNQGHLLGLQGQREIAGTGDVVMVMGGNQDVEEMQGWSIVKQMVIDAEKYKASVDQVDGKGTNSSVNFPLQTVDDEFFHLTCDVDLNLIRKIEKGEFIDLEKLDQARKLQDIYT